MKTNQTDTESIDESQSIQIIRDMIEVSRNNFSNDGILFIVWGWIFFFTTSVRFLLKKLTLTNEFASYLNKILLFLLIIGIVFSINYIYKRRLIVRTYTGQILRYLWGAIIFLNLYILIFQLNAKMNIDKLLAQYMLMLALGTFVTGGILKFKPLIYSSISFIILVQISIFVHSDYSILIAAISFIIGLVIPGHILYSKRIRQ
jgi:hypothetical protein